MTEGCEPVRVTIRLAQPHDAEAIAVTLRLAFAEFESLYTPAAFRATTPIAGEISGRFAEGPIWVAEFESTIAGTVSAVSHGSGLYIRSMAVRPDTRRTGIGKQLLDTVEAFAAEHQYRRLVLSTTPFLLSAIRLYERYGFRYTGEEPDLFGTRLLTMAKGLGKS
jgi:ribosomal protein S18 acetylase RimI-like enzyme